MTRHSDRLDHQGFVPEIFAGMLLTSLYLMQLGPTIANLNKYLQDCLSLTLFFGSAFSLIGVVLGTKWLFKHARPKASYIIHLFGIPMQIFALAWYTYATVEFKHLLITALAGGLGLCIEIGLLRLLVDLIAYISEKHHDT